MRTTVVYLDFRLVETSIWCNACLLPSGRSFEITVLTKNGVGPPRLFSGCPDCGNPTSNETPPTT